MKHIFFVILSIVLSINAQAQELNCQVAVMAPTLQGNSANDEIIQSLEQSIFEMINNTKWTDDNFGPEERIDCSILITINTRSSDNFTGTMQVQSFRPVLNSSYRSQVFNTLDKDVEFKYLRNTSIIFTPSRHSDNLAELVAYYAYIIIGTDYDTFSLEGGTKYFNKAQAIVSNAQGATERGWKSSEGIRTRYWLIDNILHTSFAPIRQFNYEYHRNGMDLFYDKKDDAMKALLSSLELLKKVHEIKPNSINLNILSLSKMDEFITVFKEAYPDQKAKAYALLKEIDSRNANKYNKILR